MLSRRAVLSLLMLPLFSAFVMPGPSTDLKVVIAPIASTRLRHWAEQVRPLLIRWWPIVVHALTGDASSTPTVIKIAFASFTARLIEQRTGSQYPLAVAHPELVCAITKGNVILVNEDYVKPRLTDADLQRMMAHEAAHVAQSYPAGACIWLKEGIADYVRYYVLFPDDPNRQFDPDKERYDQGFAPAAGLLDFVERSHPDVIRRLNAVMADGGDGEAELKVVTGCSPDLLWERYRASLTDSKRQHAF